MIRDMLQPRTTLSVQPVAVTRIVNWGWCQDLARRAILELGRAFWEFAEHFGILRGKDSFAGYCTA